MHKRFFVFIILWITLVNSPLALSWGQETHRVICDVAWRYLDVGAKREVRKLLEETSYKTFAQSCVWADKIKSNKRYQHTRPHHYINVKETSKRINTARDCGERGCVTEAIVEYANVLRGIESKKYINNRAKALMFLGHFVGDLHQPLHVAFAGDKGGTDTFLRIGALKFSLHYLWDVTIPEAGLRTGWRKSGSRLAAKITPHQLKQWQQGTPDDWGNESLALTHKIYREFKPNMTVPFRSVKKLYPSAEQRMMMAGVRLAEILNNTFD